MLVRRSWKSKISQVSQYKDVLDIWDGGSRRYERWPDGTECCWEVQSRELSCADPIEFTEVLKELPSWTIPAEVMWQERIPVLLDSDQYQIPGWVVKQEVLDHLQAQSKPHVEPQGMPQAKPQVKPQVKPHKPHINHQRHHKNRREKPPGTVN